MTAKGRATNQMIVGCRKLLVAGILGQSDQSWTITRLPWLKSFKKCRTSKMLPDNHNPLSILPHSRQRLYILAAPWDFKGHIMILKEWLPKVRIEEIPLKKAQFSV